MLSKTLKEVVKFVKTYLFIDPSPSNVRIGVIRKMMRVPRIEKGAEDTEVFNCFSLVSLFYL